AAWPGATARSASGFAADGRQRGRAVDVGRSGDLHRPDLLAAGRDLNDADGAAGADDPFAGSEVDQRVAVGKPAGARHERRVDVRGGAVLPDRDGAVAPELELDRARPAAPQPVVEEEHAVGGDLCGRVLPVILL